MSQVGAARRAAGVATRIPLRNVLLIVVALLVLLLAGTPLAYLFYKTLSGPDGFSLGGFQRAYIDTSGLGEMLVNSLQFASLSMLMGVALGGALAFLHVRTDAPFKRVIFLACLMPLIVPSMLYAIAYILIGSPSIGLLNSIVEGLVGARPFDIYSMGGMVWVQGLDLAPIAYLFMYAAFQGMDPALEESALVSGAGWPRVLRRVTAPLLMPALAGAGVIMFVLALENFEVPGIIGMQRQILVLTTAIYFTLGQYPTDYQAAGALAIGLLVLAGIAFIVSRFFSRGHAQTITGKAFQPRLIALGRWRAPAAVLIWGFAIFGTILPLGVLVYGSFLPYYQNPSMEAFSNFTLDNYRDLVEVPVIASAIRNTVVVATVSATGVMFLTSVASWLVTRTKVKGRNVLDALAFSPIVVPGLVLGLAVSFVFLYVPLPVYGTIWIFIIAFLSRYLPYGMRYASASFRQVSNELEEAALVSGAGWGRTFRRVLLPLTSSGILAGWVFVFILSFRELSAALLLYSPDTQVLSVVIFRETESGSFGLLSALSVLMIAILCAVVFVAYKLSGSLRFLTSR